MVSKKAISDMEKIIEEMTLQELVALKKSVDDWIESKQATAKEDLIKEFSQRAQQLGMNPALLFGGGPARHRRSSSGTGQRAPAAVKYRNPSNASETWSGRGREPRWLTREMASGKKKDVFLIN